MRRREFLGLWGVWRRRGHWRLRAQPDRVRRLGVLMAVAESDADVRKGIEYSSKASRTRLEGWPNIRIDYRWGERSRPNSTLAKELVDLQPDVLVGHSTPSAKGLLNQTRTIPIVFLTVTDPWAKAWFRLRIRAEISRGSRYLNFRLAPSGLRRSNRLLPVFDV